MIHSFILVILISQRINHYYLIPFNPSKHKKKRRPNPAVGGGHNTFQNKNGLGGPIEMKVCAFERGDQGASLEKRMKSFGDVVADFW